LLQNYGVEAKVLEKCEKCGRQYFSTKQFQNIKWGGRDILVCPRCYKEKEKKVCSRCGRKLDSFSNSQIVNVNDKDMLLCEFCYKDWRKATIKEMKQTTEGRGELYNVGSLLIRRGIFWTIIGIIVNVIIFLLVTYSEFPFIVIFWGIVVYGFYDIFKGIYYKTRYRPKIGE
jgi:hypothetical protein